MAILTMDIASRAMGRRVTLNAFVPLEDIQKGDNLRLLLLLHGVKGSYANWMGITDMIMLVNRHNIRASQNGFSRLAVVMASGGNGFYHPVPHKNDPSWKLPCGHVHDYEAFFGEELPETMRFLLPLSGRAEDTMIAGLSMGGYGALLLGMKHPGTFGRVGGFSSALVTRESRAFLQNDGFYGREEFLSQIYGDFEEAKHSPAHDVQEAVHALMQERGRENMPAIYLACGTEDPLLPLSRGLDAALTAMGVKHRYEEHEGAHEWAFWQWGLSRLLLSWNQDMEASSVKGT